MALDFTWQDGERVMFIGDSITEDPQGMMRLAPAMVTARYPERRIEYFPRGVGGNRIGDVLERVTRDILGNEPAPTWIGISLGINDIFQGAAGTPLGRFRDLYSSLLERLAGTKATLVCFTTTVFGEELNTEQNRLLAGYNDAIREIAFAHGAQVVDMNTAFRDAILRAQSVNPDFRYTVDGVHLTTYGHYLMAMTLLKALNFSLGVDEFWQEERPARAA